MADSVDSTSSSNAATAAATPPAGGAADSAAIGRDLVSRATDPTTGQVDTRTLSGWVAEARQQDPQAAAEAEGAIEGQLIAQGRIGDLSRFNEDLRAATENPTAPGSYGVPGMLLEGGRQAANAGSSLLGQGQALTAAGTRALTDNPILSKVWESTQSAWTNRSGFTAPLRDTLTREGITIEPRVNPAPAGSIGRNQGVAPAVANNTNGNLARDAIADRYRANFPNADVRTEVPTSGGARRVDIRADIPAADPRMSQRIDIESKAYRASNTVELRGQAALDGAELRANRAARDAGLAMEEAGQALSRTGRALETVGRVARPVGVALAALEVGQAFRADGNRVGENTGRAASGLVGGGLGAWGGAAAGAAIGSVVPGVGTLIGGVVGGIIGGIGGDIAGRGIFNTISGWF